MQRITLDRLCGISSLQLQPTITHKTESSPMWGQLVSLSVLKLRRLQSEVAIAQGLHQRRIILVDISDRTPRARSLHHGTVNKNSMIFLNVSLDNRANHDKVSAATARMVRRRDYWVQFLLMASKNGALWAQAVEPLLERSITTPA